MESTMDEQRHLHNELWKQDMGSLDRRNRIHQLCTRQLSGMQYAPRTLGLADFIGLFKH